MMTSGPRVVNRRRIVAVWWCITAFISSAWADTAMAAAAWTIDPAHSSLEFAIRHLGVATVKGRATELTGTIAGGDEPRIEGAVPVFHHGRTGGMVPSPDEVVAAARRAWSVTPDRPIAVGSGEGSRA